MKLILIQIKKLDIDIINFKKPKDSPAKKVSLKISAKDSVINFKEIEFKENKNLIKFENLKIYKKNFVSLKTLKAKKLSLKIILIMTLRLILIKKLI